MTPSKCDYSCLHRQVSECVENLEQIYHHRQECNDEAQHAQSTANVWLGTGLPAQPLQLTCRRSSATRPCSALPPQALAVQQPVLDLAEGLETPVQLIYLLTLLGFLVVGAYLVVRQVCFSVPAGQMCCRTDSLLVAICAACIVRSCWFM